MKTTRMQNLIAAMRALVKKIRLTAVGEPLQEEVEGAGRPKAGKEGKEGKEGCFRGEVSE